MNKMIMILMFALVCGAIGEQTGDMIRAQLRIRPTRSIRLSKRVYGLLTWDD